LELNSLNQNFNELEKNLSNKKENNYDISSVSLNGLRDYIKNAESDLLAENSQQANINLKLAFEEYDYQKNRLDSTKKIPAVSKIKDYAIIFSTFAGAILTFFALYELLKKKSTNIVSKISEAKTEKKE